MRLLIWHWGRNGAGPRYAASLADALRAYTDTTALLSLPETAEILATATPPALDLPVRTYRNHLGFLLRAASAPWHIGALAKRIRRLRPDLALCAMPAMLDLLMAAALRRAGIGFAVVVHDAAAHFGEYVPLQHRLQRALLKRADLLITLTEPVAQSLRDQGFNKPLLRTVLPPLVYGNVPPPIAHGGPYRLLCFGRLLPYKGLDLLAEAWEGLPPDKLTLRVVGQGPESAELERLRGLPNVVVENRWVPEAEMVDLLTWPDAIVLPYREASQSGVAAAALAAGRIVVATSVGGLADQLRDEPAAILCEPSAAGLAAALAMLPGRACPASASSAERWRDTARNLADALTPFKKTS